MKKLSVKILVSLLTCVALTAHAADKGGNGGGGVNNNGIYMTFYSAGLYVEPVDGSQAPVLLPAVNQLIKYISQMSFLDVNARAKLMEAVVATSKRKYFIATPEQLTPEVKARILAEYQRVTGVDASHLVLLAITDTIQRNTFILPGFEKLSQNDQMSILFHETYWLMFPNSTYNDVVSAEMAFEATLVNPQNLAAVYDLVKRIGTTDDTRNAMAKWDVKSGNLIGFLSSTGKFLLKDFYGDEFFDCVEQNGPLISSMNYENYPKICVVFLRNHINDLMAQYPKSMLLRIVAERMDDEGEVFKPIVDGNPPYAWSAMKDCEVDPLVPDHRNTSCPQDNQAKSGPMPASIEFFPLLRDSFYP